ncbi:unnamed protein product, partial [Protopolystoma xenopodis]
MVENIVGRKQRNGKILYRVRWEGFPPDQDSWEPLENLRESCLPLIKSFHLRHRRDNVSSRRSSLNSLLGRTRSQSEQKQIPDLLQTSLHKLTGYTSNAEQSYPDRSPSLNMPPPAPIQRTNPQRLASINEVTSAKNFASLNLSSTPNRLCTIAAIKNKRPNFTISSLDQNRLTSTLFEPTSAVITKLAKTLDVNSPTEELVEPPLLSSGQSFESTDSLQSKPFSRTLPQEIQPNLSSKPSVRKSAHTLIPSLSAACKILTDDTSVESTTKLSEPDQLVKFTSGSSLKCS